MRALIKFNTTRIFFFRAPGTEMSYFFYFSSDYEKVLMIIMLEFESVDLNIFIQITIVHVFIIYIVQKLDY